MTPDWSKSVRGVPIIVNVDENLQPFYTKTGDGEWGAKVGSNHTIVVTGYHDGKVEYYDPNGKQYDNNGGHPPPLEQIRLAALGADDAIPALKTMIDANHASGHENAYLNFEYLRLKLQEGDFKTYDEYKKEFRKTLKETNDRWREEEKKAAAEHRELTHEQKEERALAKFEIMESPTSTPGVDE